MAMPLTPNTPGIQYMPPFAPPVDQDAEYHADTDRRKLSIRSLLAQPSTCMDDDRNYGFDQGRRDIDLPRNDDANALIAFSPSATLRKLDFSPEDGVRADEVDDMLAQSRDLDDPELDASAYYSNSVPVTIPTALEPLPDVLSNPMNLLYFHHFLNHTARLLVLHDCHYNVLRHVLPQMAIHNENLLNLLLAYAAHHRARLLRYPEPVNRIATWVRLVFAELRHALIDTRDTVSDANLGAAIMLASLEIISTNAFEASIPWQSHLGLAREFIILRGGYSGLRAGNKVSQFLSRWFAYLDVLGSLSGSANRPLPDARGLDDIPDAPNSEDDMLDCFLGFTGRCINILHEIAWLAKECEIQRIGLDDAALLVWRPPGDLADRAYQIESLLHSSMSTSFTGCNVGGEADLAVNEAYHLAGLIHLCRRILNYATCSEKVANAGARIFAILEGADDRRLGVMIFPIFTAGFEAQQSDLRAVAYLKRVEKLGMAQAGKARELLENAKQDPQPWDRLMAGEGAFIG